MQRVGSSQCAVGAVGSTSLLASAASTGDWVAWHARLVELLAELTMTGLIVVCFCVLLAGLVALLEALQHLAASDCEGPGVLLPTAAAAAAAGGPRGQLPAHQGVVPFMMRVLHKRHIAALQVS